MAKDKIYSTDEIAEIARLCRVYDCELLALDLLVEGLTIDEAKRRLMSIDDELKQKSVATSRKGFTQGESR
jgi:hypothetical protein